uniref:Uncharacterized protein n=1 Tax=Ixodes ricinus TaxID=34613 RepID=A0A6B0US71_IXORI
MDTSRLLRATMVRLLGAAGDAAAAGAGACSWCRKLLAGIEHTLAGMICSCGVGVRSALMSRSAVSSYGLKGLERLGSFTSATMLDHLRRTSSALRDIFLASSSQQARLAPLSPADRSSAALSATNSTRRSTSDAE